MNSIGARIERIPDNPYNRKLLLQTGLGYIYDSLDGTMLSLVLPALSIVWALSSAQTGVLASSIFFGYFFGTIAAGYLGDKFGRKKIIMYTLVIYCLASLISALATNWTSFFWARVVAGFGTGGEAAIIAPYLSEMISSKHRGRYVSMLTGCFALGNIVASILSYFIIPSSHNGWRIAVVITALPIIAVLFWRRYLPESPRWLENVGRLDEANRVMEHIEKEAERYLNQKLGEPNTEFKSINNNDNKIKSTILLLFGKQYIKITSMLWIVWFTMIYVNFGFTSWLPSLLVKKGFSFGHTFAYSILIFVGQYLGYLLGSFLVEKIGRKPSLITSMICATFSAFALGQSNSGVMIVIFGMCLAACMSFGFGVLYAYTPELYPTAIRATGMGASSAFARIGAILAPIVIGYMYPILHFSGVFTMLCVVLLIGAIFLMILGIETKEKSLDNKITENTSSNTIF